MILQTEWTTVLANVDSEFLRSIHCLLRATKMASVRVVSAERSSCVFMEGRYFSLGLLRFCRGVRFCALVATLRCLLTHT